MKACSLDMVLHVSNCGTTLSESTFLIRILYLSSVSLSPYTKSCFGSLTRCKATCRSLGRETYPWTTEGHGTIFCHVVSVIIGHRREFQRFRAH